MEKYCLQNNKRNLEPASIISYIAVLFISLFNKNYILSIICLILAIRFMVLAYRDDKEKDNE